MYRSYYAEIFVLLLLYYAGWNFPTKNAFKCSRIKSRLVRIIIVKKVLPILNRYKLSLPISCPFHSERDLLWWPDIQIDFQDGQWVCPFCGRAFSSEEMVMHHWDKTHTNYESEDTLCFGNFCDIFRCQVILASLELEKKKKFELDSFASFPYSQNRTSCDHKKMSVLQRKCKVVMGDCLLGLLTKVSTKDFLDIEAEVNQAICSYLTCKKYSDGSLQVVQPVPVLFVLILGVVLIGGFYFCYYVVYMLSYPDANINQSFCNGGPQMPLKARQKDNFVYRRNNKGGYYAQSLQ